MLASTDPGARLAAAVSLARAAGKTRDHVADRDGALPTDRLHLRAVAAGLEPAPGRSLRPVLAYEGV